jgi:hypothetical protein
LEAQADSANAAQSASAYCIRTGWSALFQSISGHIG